MFVFVFFFVVFCIFFLINLRRRKIVIDLFSQGNVIISGLRGRGKDMLTCFVINSRNKPYVSNVRYDSKGLWRPLDLSVWAIGGNRYSDFVDGMLKPYVYPYPDGLDYYVSDAGVYFPSQFANELCKRYGSATLFQALSRHLGDCNVHVNVQNIGRVWDKIREQSDLYVVCDRCKVLFKRFARPLVHQRVYIYDLQETADKRLKMPFFGIGKCARQLRAQWETVHGSVKKVSFWFFMPYKYDDRIFKSMLEKGCVKDA